MRLMIREPDSRHRAALLHDRFGAHAGNMKGVRELSCTVHGSVANTLYVFHNHGEWDDFSPASWSSDAGGPPI
jgi:hypothetical protein